MVADDNPELIEVVRVMLETKGYNVMYANGGKELFAGLEKQKPDLNLLLEVRDTRPYQPIVSP